MKKTTISVNVDRIPSNSPLFTAVQFIESLDVFLADFEIKYIDIGAHTVRVLRLGERNEPRSTVQCYRVVGQWCKHTHAGETSE